VVAALPRHAKRRLRAACRAGRAAVDSRVTALSSRVSAAGLPAAVARMPRLRSLECFVDDEGGAELACALAAAPASLTALTHFEWFPPGSADGVRPPRALADAIAARPGLAELYVHLERSPGLCGAFVAAVGRLSRLRTLRLSAGLQDEMDPDCRALSCPVLGSDRAGNCARICSRAGYAEPTMHARRWFCPAGGVL
jgi:hypothetical protein